jgi:4-hydroxy-tetrahydrodipicolinate synthase
VKDAMPNVNFSGLLVPAATPFGPDLTIDQPTFVKVCRWLLAEGAHGLAVFGTTSEANSLSIPERRDALEGLIGSGIPADVLLPGVGMSALPDAVDLTRHAISLGCGGVLVLPPFYYKPVWDDGLFAFYAELIERVGSEDLGLWLYHIPQNTGVPITHALIERLRTRYPQTVLGIKDSSGDWTNTQALITQHPGFRVFPSSEGVMLKALRLGGVGCISASGNVNAAGIRSLYDGWAGPDAEALQAAAAKIRTVVGSYTLVPAVKAVLAARLGVPSLGTLRPPLTALDAAQRTELLARLEAVGYHLQSPTTATA